MNDSSIAIRRAVPDDAEPIAQVQVTSWHTTYPGIVDQGYIDSLVVSERADAWARRLTMNAADAPDILVAVTREKGVVGFLSGGKIREPFPGFDAELHAIYLLQPFQKMGLGERLTRGWAARAVARGFHSAVVRVLAHNPACAFYERLGATLLREAALVIGGQPYPERWYGWHDLADLAA